MRGLVTFLLALVLTAAVVGVSAGGEQAVIDPLLPDLEQRLPYSLGVSQQDGRFRLGFASAVSNVGAGPLLVAASRRSLGATVMPARQEVVTRGGRRRALRLVGNLTYVRSETHEHWHLLPFEHYELRGAEAPFTVVRALKTGFCLGDRYRDRKAASLNAPPTAVFRHECGKGAPHLLRLREGISVGYGDDYKPNLEGQSFDLTGLPAGDYVLTHQVNLTRRIRERTYANNAASLLVRLQRPDGGGPPTVRILRNCPASVRCAAG